MSLQSTMHYPDSLVCGLQISATCLADFARVVCDEGGKKGIEAIEIL